MRSERAGGHVKRQLLVGACALALMAAACGDDDTTSADDSGSGSEEAPSGDASAAPLLPSDEGLELPDPIQLVLLAEVPGESQVAAPWSNDGAQMAVDELNEAGGFGGHDVEIERISAPVLDPAASQTSVLRGIDQDPTAMLGLQATGQALQSNDSVGDAGIPTLHESSADQVIASHPDSISNPYGFLQRPPQSALAKSLMTVALDDLGLENPALICTDDQYGTNGCNAAEATAGEAGVEIVDEVSAEATQTDFTSQVLELQSSGADGVVAFLYPAALPTFLDQLADHGFDVPVLSSSASLGWQDVTSGNLENLHGVEDCIPAADPRLEVQDWVARYEELYDYTPTFQSAEHYDAVMLVADAVARAGSTDHAAVREALAATDYEGVCGTYTADDSQGLLHTAASFSFTSDGPVFEDTLDLGDFTFEG